MSVIGKINDARQILQSVIDGNFTSTGKGGVLHPVLRLLDEAIEAIPDRRDPVMDDHDAGWNDCLDKIRTAAIKSSDKLPTAIKIEGIHPKWKHAKHTSLKCQRCDEMFSPGDGQAHVVDNEGQRFVCYSCVDKAAQSFFDAVRSKARRQR